MDAESNSRSLTIIYYTTLVLPDLRRHQRSQFGHDRLNRRAARKYSRRAELFEWLNICLRNDSADDDMPSLKDGGAIDYSHDVIERVAWSVWNGFGTTHTWLHFRNGTLERWEVHAESN